MTGPGKTAWVLAGGGSLGAVQVGMLRALVEFGARPDFVVGASVGAINGAYFAGRPDAAGVDALEQIWCGLRRDDVFPISLLTGLRNGLLQRSYTVNPDGLARVIRNALPYRKLEDARVPIQVVATDLLSGEEVRLSQGPVEAALLASAAIPAVFPAVRWNNRHLVDGGVASNTPLAAAVKLGATRVVVLPTGSSCALPEPPRGVMAVALHALNLLIMRQLAQDVSLFGARADIVIVPPLCPLSVSVFDFSHGQNLILRAHESTHAWLAAGGLTRRDLPHALQPHHHG